MRIRPILRIFLVMIVCLPLLGRSALAPADLSEKVRSFTRLIEFDYISWTLDALLNKLSFNALGADRYLPPKAQHDLVIDYLDTIKKEAETSQEINLIYSNPKEHDPRKTSNELRNRQADYEEKLNLIGPLVETILQAQLNNVTASLGLDPGGEPIPPIWYQSTATPLALIISPRSSIRTEADVSLTANLPLDQIQDLETRIGSSLDVSALVVPVGGIGIYPTMVMQTTDLPWLVETIAHEWTHNFLTLHPLGLSYEMSSELRTMNETTASIVGKEVGAALIERYYPELQTQEATPSQPASSGNVQASAPVFNYNNEMRQTRVKTDQLLAAGNIAEAETYMEQRRTVFWENGYYIRKLNQAYFAFYGAYADEPGGAAGADPVGPAVRALRNKSGSLKAFLNRMAWMTSFAELKQAVQ